MSKRIAKFIGFIMLFVLFTSPAALYSAEEEKTKSSERVRNATLVIEEFMRSPDREAASQLMGNGVAVAIFPSVLKGAFFVGAQYGQGVMCAYDKKTQTFSTPAFFTIGGGSFGFQFGAESADLIFVVMNQRGLESLLKGKGTLGADVSVAAGPVGRKAQAETDVLLKAEIYSYSRVKGVFLGVALQGAVIAPNNEANRDFYGEFLFPQDILLHKRVKPVGSAVKLVSALSKFVRE
jgi:lipid-binding SYLF domain-containing protein